MPKARLFFDGDNSWIEKEARIYSLTQEVEDKLDSISDFQDEIDDLQDQINNLASRGRYLSTWNCVTWLPGTDPQVDPYVYRAWDYYIVSVVWGTNLRPSGAEYHVQVPSQVVESQSVSQNDLYIYDWIQWVLQQSWSSLYAVWWSITWTLSAQTDLQNALDAKANKTDVLEKTNTTSYTPTADYHPATKKYADDGLSNKQATLVSGTNIKSINSNSLLGSWNLSIAEVPSGWTNWQVLTVVSGSPAWANASWWDVLVSSQPNNILQSWMKIRAWTEWDYGSLGVYDSNTVYLTVPWAATPWRHPWANTIAYYPLETDANDYSWNSRDATNNWATFTTEGWVDCASFSDGTTKISLPALWTLTTLTASVWFKTININPDSVILQIAPSTNDENFVLGCNNWTWALSRYTWTSYNITDWNVSDWTWHNMVGTYTSSWWAKLYVDWVYIWDDSTATTVSWDLGYSFIWWHQSWQSWYAYIGYISNVILEDKEWTSTEVSDYYDETKWDYWIS